MAKNQEIGKLGEDAVAEYLCKLGWRVIKRNQSVPGGEIDIVAREPKSGILVFVEVKAQAQTTPRFKPEDQYRARKKRITARSCQWFAGRHPELVQESVGWRIDLVTIVLGEEGTQINHYKNT